MRSKYYANSKPYYTSHKNHHSNHKINESLNSKQAKQNKHHLSQKNDNSSQPVLEGHCAICDRISDNCCSLCMKVFYCSTEHQQADWHIKHKNICEGRHVEAQQEYEQKLHENPSFAFYTGKTQKNKSKSRKKNSSNQKYLQAQNYHKSNSKTAAQKQKTLMLYLQQEQNNLKRFLGLLEERLIVRERLLINLQKSRSQRTPQLIRQALLKQAQQLLQLSTQITKKQYKPSYSKKKISVCADQNGKIVAYHTQYSSISQMQANLNQINQKSLSINDTNILIEYIADYVLFTTICHNGFQKKKVRQLLIGVGRLLEDNQQQNVFLKIQQMNPENNLTPNEKAKLFSSQLNTKINILVSIIRLSQLYRIDRTTEIMHKLFIKLIQKYEGIWQSIYAYFNIGVWYAKKTYYEKSIKAFMFCLQILQSHKKTGKQSVIFKADIHYNMANAYWVIGEQTLAIQNMQNCYRSRVNGIGKNSIEASYCLSKLAKWYKQLQKWQQCIQYLEQCHRIRKQHEDTDLQVQAVKQIKQQILEVYLLLKKKMKQDIDPQTYNRYEMLIKNQSNFQQEQISKAESQFKEQTVTKRLFEPQKQEIVQFKINISSQMFQTYDKTQTQYLQNLFDFTDEKMTKSQAIRLITQSKFYEQLNQKQLKEFLEVNGEYLQ